MDELIVQPRLADTWFTDHGDRLSRPAAGPLQRRVEGVHFAVAADKAGEPGRCRRLQAGAELGGARKLVRLDRLWHPLHRDRSERPELDEAFGKPQRVDGHADGSGASELLHSRGEMRRRADRVVVHRQIVANRANHDLARVNPDPGLRLYAVIAPGPLR